MNEKNMLDAFAIITDAGDASAKFLEALKATQECDFEKSAALIEEGRESLVKAHQKQTVMLQQEASGEETEMSLIMDGTDIPFGHITFTSGQIPVILYTTRSGMEYCRKALGRKAVVIDSLEGCPSSLDTSAVYIAVTGEDRIDNRLGLKMLRRMARRISALTAPPDGSGRIS